MDCGLLTGYKIWTTNNVGKNDKKRIYTSRVMEVEQARFTPLAFTTTGGVAPECQVYHKPLAELLSAKKGEDYSTTMS